MAQSISASNEEKVQKKEIRGRLKKAIQRIVE
jgi:hypothetical protein